jgi:hypothetical protein
LPICTLQEPKFIEAWSSLTSLTLDVDVDESVYLDRAVALLKSATHITSLKLATSFKSIEKVMDTLVATQASLQSLILGRASFQPSLLRNAIFRHQHTLKNLELFDADLLDDGDWELFIKEIPRLAPSLERLVLEEIFDHIDYTDVMLFDPRFENELKTLDVDELISMQRGKRGFSVKRLLYEGVEIKPVCEMIAKAIHESKQPES